jgi:hypothetical protein
MCRICGLRNHPTSKCPYSCKMTTVEERENIIGLSAVIVHTNIHLTNVGINQKNHVQFAIFVII